MKKITIDGVEHELDMDKALSLGVLKRKIQHRIGNRYKNINNGNTYILSGTEYSHKNFYLALINLENGLSFGFSPRSFPLKIRELPDETFAFVADNKPEQFSLIDDNN